MARELAVYYGNNPPNVLLLLLCRRAACLTTRICIRSSTQKRVPRHQSGRRLSRHNVRERVCGETRPAIKVCRHFAVLSDEGDRERAVKQFLLRSVDNQNVSAESGTCWKNNICEASTEYLVFTPTLHTQVTNVFVAL